MSALEHKQSNRRDMSKFKKTLRCFMQISFWLTRRGCAIRGNGESLDRAAGHPWQVSCKIREIRGKGCLQVDVTEMTTKRRLFWATTSSQWCLSWAMFQARLFLFFMYMFEHKISTQYLYLSAHKTSSILRTCCSGQTLTFSTTFPAILPAFLHELQAFVCSEVLLRMTSKYQPHRGYWPEHSKSIESLQS